MTPRPGSPCRKEKWTISSPSQKEKFSAPVHRLGSRRVGRGPRGALLSREIGTAPRGRAWSVVLYPFSFAEALSHRGQAVPAAPALLTGADRSRLERAFNGSRWAAFPNQRLDAPSRRQSLRDYVDLAILRDVVERHGVTNIAGLRWLVWHLLASAGSLFSDPGTAAREIAALQETGRHREGARRWLLTLTRDRLPANPPDDVTCCPAYEWMLAEGGASAPE